VGSFQDYPIDPYGLSGDEAYLLLQTITDDVDQVYVAIDALSISSINAGADFPESQLTALYQATTGLAQNVGAYTIAGGQEAGFREGASKFIVLWTDSTFHRAESEPDYPGYETQTVFDALAWPSS
jgi:hypothetical protein